ncbi:MAG: hypothetical protein H2058_08335 [Muricauda sp.]|nr:DnaB-like helicase C-terminal domain-containing protein [Allomuricauda sp.]MBA4745253.1 hypothetical protein [Allomuricauda sp.]
MILKERLASMYTLKTWGLIESGIPALDDNSTFEQGKTTLLAARPGMFAKRLIDQLILRVCIQNKNPLAHFSFERSVKETIDHFLWCLTLDTRFLSSDSYSEELVNSEAIDNAFKLFEQSPYWIETRKEYTCIESLIDLLRKRVENHKIRLVVIDYLELCGSIELSKNKSMPIEKKKSIELKKLKAIARELDVHIIITSVLSNYVDIRPYHEKRPEIDDINIEKPFDCVDNIMLVYRPEFYGIKQWDIFGNKKERLSTRNCLEISLHQKESFSGKCLLEFNNPCTEFRDITPF